MFEGLQSFSFSAACSPWSELLPLLHTMPPWGSILLWAQDQWDQGLQTEIPENVNRKKNLSFSPAVSVRHLVIGIMVNTVTERDWYPGEPSGASLVIPAPCTSEFLG